MRMAPDNKIGSKIYCLVSELDFVRARFKLIFRAEMKINNYYICIGFSLFYLAGLNYRQRKR